MKLSLPKPSRKSASSSKAAAGPRTRVPRALEDLYRDMRDRRLLLPALLLVVAIVAVPVALSTPKAPAPEPLAFVPPEGAEAVAPAVLTERTVGVRDYRERLKELKRKNPFNTQFEPKPADVEAATQLSEPASASPSPTTDPEATGAPPSPPVVDITPSSPPEPVDPPTPAEPPAPDREVLVLEPRIDVGIGPVGEPKKIENVETGKVLPRRGLPLVVFVGTDRKLREARFMVSRDVTRTEGKGKCAGTSRDCKYLSVRVGKKRFLEYGPTGKRYALKVKDIYEKVVDRRTLEAGEEP